jgi:acyl carrier protein
MNANTIEATIATYVASNLFQGGSGSVPHDASLVDLGVLDSMAVAAMLAFAEAEFGIVVDESDITLENVVSVNAVAALVRRKRGVEAVAAAGSARP